RSARRAATELRDHWAVKRLPSRVPWRTTIRVGARAEELPVVRCHLAMRLRSAIGALVTTFAAAPWCLVACGAARAPVCTASPPASAAPTVSSDTKVAVPPHSHASPRVTQIPEVYPEAECARVEGTEFPRADRPSQDELPSLRDCDSEILYYGIGRSP